VQRLYWVQFEGYLPSKPHLHHQYDSPQHATIGGPDFYVDTWIREKNEKSTPGSDLEHIEAVIRAKGYKMPAGMMMVRLVHLLDEQKAQRIDDHLRRGLCAHWIYRCRSEERRQSLRSVARHRKESGRDSNKRKSRLSGQSRRNCVRDL
jgi:hypothetical protein